MATPSEISAGQTIPTNLGMMNPEEGPATPSVDHKAMQLYWETAAALLDGLDAVKAGKEKYLPKHPEEQQGDYDYRLSTATLTNIFADIVETLAAKPFSKECHIIDGSADPEFIGKPVMKADAKDPTKKTDTGKRVGGFQEDVDGKGSHLHVFAHEVFYQGMAQAIDWIFVDYPKIATNLTRAQELKMFVRPYWYRIPALSMLEVQSAMSGGKEIFIYARFMEWKQVRVGFTTELRQRVREIIRDRMTVENEPAVYGVPYFKVYEKDPNSKAIKEADKWLVVDKGLYTIGEIPMVPFVAGRRKGSSWQFHPPMKTAVDLQIKLYRQESGLENVKNLVCYPMLAGSGVELTDDQGNAVEITIGPHTILATPPSDDGAGRAGEWKFLEPGSQSLEFCRKTAGETKEELRELGRQPLTAQSGNITTITSAFVSEKANSAVESWATRLKDSLENAMRLTALWMKSASEPEVYMHTDFPVAGNNDASATLLQNMRKDRDISRETYWDEMQRRDVLGPEFDADVEKQRLMDEIPVDPQDMTEDPVNAANPNNEPDKPGYDASKPTITPTDNQA